MATRKCVAVLGIGRPTDYKKVLALAETVANALTTNSSVYTAPDPTVVALSAQIAILLGYINAVRDGDHSKIGLRDEASKTLYAMLQQELIYVNKTGNNDRGILMLSGFPLSNDPTPRHVPVQVIIKRIVDGKEPNTAKISIESVGQTPLTYIVQKKFTVNSVEAWQNIIVTQNSRDFIVTDLVHGEEVWFRVCAQNANGAGEWSVPVSFIYRK